MSLMETGSLELLPARGEAQCYRCLICQAQPKSIASHLRNYHDKPLGVSDCAHCSKSIEYNTMKEVYAGKLFCNKSCHTSYMNSHRNRESNTIDYEEATNVMNVSWVANYLDNDSSIDISIDKDSPVHIDKISSFDLRREYPLHLSSFYKLQARSIDNRMDCGYPRNADGFRQFVHDIGPIPEGMVDQTVGRIDHSKGYIKGNFEWQTRSDNSAEVGQRSRKVILPVLQSLTKDVTHDELHKLLPHKSIQYLYGIVLELINKHQLPIQFRYETAQYWAITPAESYDVNNLYLYNYKLWKVLSEMTSDLYAVELLALTDYAHKNFYNKVVDIIKKHKLHRTIIYGKLLHFKVIVVDRHYEEITDYDDAHNELLVDSTPKDPQTQRVNAG